MKTTKILTALIATAAIAALNTAKADFSPYMVDKVSIVSVDKMTIQTNDDQYQLRVGLTFQNENPTACKLRKGSFRTVAIGKHLASDSKSAVTNNLEIGQGEINDLVLPGSDGKDNKGITTAELIVDLGHQDADTMARIISLWNLVGNTDNQVSLFLDGTAEVGAQLKNGYVFPLGAPYEVELTFQPKLQRSVLFQ